MANLILYYSRRGENYAGGAVVRLEKGNTEIVAEYIQRAVGGELFELETEKPYAGDYDTCIWQAKAELEQGARPALKNSLRSIAAYDNIFICGPCWWGTYPCAVFSQIERLDFAGKRVFPVMTHEGSGLGRGVRDLQRLCNGASFGEGLAVVGSRAAQSAQAIADWVCSCV